MLFEAVDAAEEKAHAHDQQQIGQHTANEGGLDNDDLLLHQRDDGDDQFDGVTG